MRSPMVRSLSHAVAVFLYVLLVVSILSNGSKLFGEEDTFWMPVMGLLLFVLSATVVGSLVLGKPILMYISGEKKEAVQFLGYTVGWLFLFLGVLVITNLK